MSQTIKDEFYQQGFDGLKNVIAKQNERLEFLEQQNNQRKEETHILRATISNHEKELDQINQVLLEANLIRNTERSFYSSENDNATSIINRRRVKRPARLLPAYILR